MYGTSPHGVRSFTWPRYRAPRDLPEINILFPLDSDVPTSGGPAIQVTWDWTSEDPQTEYRITVTSGAIVVTTGWIQSIFSTGPINVVLGGIPPDGPIEVKVEAASLHRGYYDTAISHPVLAFGQPSVRWTQPDPQQLLWSQPQVVGNWEYFDSKSKAQGAFRVRLIRGGTVMHDSGWIQSAAKTYAVPFLLQDGTRYSLGLRTLNTNGVESVAAP